MSDKVNSFITTAVEAAVKAAEDDNPNSPKREGSVRLIVHDARTNCMVTVIVEAHGLVDGKPRRHYHADEVVSGEDAASSAEKFQSIRMTSSECVADVSGFLHSKFAASEFVDVRILPANTPVGKLAGSSDDGKLSASPEIA